MAIKLYVGNLPASTTSDELMELFAQAGEIVQLDLVKSPQNGLPKGYAFITMNTQSEIDKAISMFHLYLLRDHALKVGLANPRRNRDKKMPDSEL
ncbi:MAG: RNA-binding protein [Anaerolineales bacterium]|nr:RNA-binding protein [Anaerolineales bacterium]